MDGVEDYQDFAQQVRAMGYPEASVQAAWNAGTRATQRVEIESEAKADPTPEEIEEYENAPEPDLQVNDLYSDENWMAASKILYEAEEGEAFQGTPEDLMEWSVNEMANFNWRIFDMSYYAVQANSRGGDYAQALGYLINTYDRVDTDFNIFKKSAGAFFTDPTNLMGFGGGFVASKVAAGVAKNRLKKILASSTAQGAITAGYEGALFGTGEDLARQTVDIAAENQEGYDLGQAATMGGVTAAAAATMGGTLALSLSKPARELYKRTGRKALDNAKAARPMPRWSRAAQTGAINPDPIRAMRVVDNGPESPAWKEAKAKGLDMSQPARMERAQAMGFDTERVWYHGTPSEGTPVEFMDVSVGGVPLFNRGNPVDYSPHQYTNNPTPKDYARANLQESLYIEENRLEDAAFSGGEEGFLNEVAAIIDEQIDSYADDWPEIVPELKKIKARLKAGDNKFNFEGGPSPEGIEEFSLGGADDGLYGRGIYMTDAPSIAGGGESNEIAELGYATARGRRKESPAVYKIVNRVENPWNPDKKKFRKKDLPDKALKQLADYFDRTGKNIKGKWPMSDESLRYYMGNDWVNALLQELGYDGIVHEGGRIMGAPPHTVTVAFDPSQIRSVNAAFDPDSKASANLLKSVGGGAVIGAASQQEKEDDSV
jgi:hypothetical protein